MTTAQFKQLILPLKHKLFRFAMSYVSHEAEAKDVVQEVMLTTWKEIKDPQEIANLEAWCITVTRNQALARLRKKKRMYLPIEEQHHLPSQAASPLEETEARESEVNIKRLISLLPDNQKAVVMLRDVEGHSYKEIAHMLKMEMSQVKILLHRGRKRIREQLTKVYNYGITQA